MLSTGQLVQMKTRKLKIQYFFNFFSQLTGFAVSSRTFWELVFPCWSG